jgi:hypothetical protein
VLPSVGGAGIKEPSCHSIAGAPLRDTSEASAATWKPSDAPPDKGIEIDNRDLRARVQKRQRITESEWEAMGAISERLTRNHYVVVNGQFYSPSQLKIHCTAEAVKSAVHSEATQINATHEADVSTLKKIMEWIQPSQTAAHVDVAKDPKEWNEWIAILAMKPGEDPKTLERRRDLWLQCHSMKCVMRMILRSAVEGTATSGASSCP